MMGCRRSDKICLEQMIEFKFEEIGEDKKRKKMKDFKII